MLKVIKRVLINLYCHGLLSKQNAQTLYDWLQLKNS
jgi:hypothetical protein